MRSLAGLLLLSASAVSAQDLPISRGVNLYSVEKEKSLGAQSAADLLKNATPLKSDVALAYMRYVGARLAAQLPQPLVFPYEFTITAQSDGPAPLEPVALPGGYIFIPAGLIRAARNEAEFAGALAHAMAHVAARHATRTASRGQIADLATVPLGLGTRPALVPAAFVRFEMGFESEADVLAVNLASRAGYDPAGLASYIERAQGGANDDRVQMIRTAIAALPQRTYSPSGDFAIIQDEVRRLAPPTPAPPK